MKVELVQGVKAKLRRPEGFRAFETKMDCIYLEQYWGWQRQNS